MNKNIEKTVKEIIKELSEFDNSFKEKWKELEKIISKMVQIKPEIKIDENFRNELRQNILENFSEEKNFSKEKKNFYLSVKNFFKNFSKNIWKIFWINDFMKIFWWFVWWAVSFAFVLNIAPNFSNNPNQYLDTEIQEIWNINSFSMMQAEPEIESTEVAPTMLKRWIRKVSPVHEDVNTLPENMMMDENMENAIMMDFEESEMEAELDSFSDEWFWWMARMEKFTESESAIATKKEPIYYEEIGWKYVLTVEKNHAIILLIIDWIINISLISLIFYLIFRRRK